MKSLVLLLVICCAAHAQTTKIINPSSLQDWWPMEEGSGSTVSDRGLVGDTGTVSNTSWATGVIGRCLSFNASSSFLDFPTAAQPAYNQPFSIVIWFNITTVSATRRVLFNNYESVGQAGYYLSMESSMKLNFRFGSNATNFRRAETAATIIQQVWHMAVGVWDGSSTATVYMDGIGTSNNHSTGGTVASFAYSFSTTLGKNSYGPSHWWFGRLDEPRYFNRAMTAAEVQYLYFCGRQGVE